MPINWRENEETVAAFVDSSALSGLGKSVIVGPTEAVVVIRNGEMDEVFDEGRIKTRGFRDALKAMVGAGPEVQTLIVDISPYRLTYWLDNPGVVRKRDDEIALDLPAITKDGEPISAQVNITFVVDRTKAHLLLRMMHGSNSISRETIGRELRDEFLAKTLSREVSKYDSSELRGNDDLLKRIWNDAKVQLDSTIKGYGLNLNDSYINWGLTADEQGNIDQRRRNEEIKEAEHGRRLEDIEDSGENRSTTKWSVGRDVVTTTSSGINGITIVLIVGVVLVGVILIMLVLGG
jgi:hypothetical protein